LGRERERERELTMPLIWEMLDGDVVLTVLRGDATTHQWIQERGVFNDTKEKVWSRALTRAP
jgi:hypothetical protein